MNATTIHWVTQVWNPEVSLDFLLFLPESNWLSNSVDPKIDFFL